jgi:hypothetical protein
MPVFRVRLKGGQWEVIARIEWGDSVRGGGGEGVKLNQGVCAIRWANRARERERELSGWGSCRPSRRRERSKERKKEKKNDESQSERQGEWVGRERRGVSGGVFDSLWSYYVVYCIISERKLCALVERQFDFRILFDLLVYLNIKLVKTLSVSSSLIYVLIFDINNHIF